MCAGMLVFSGGLINAITLKSNVLFTFHLRQNVLAFKIACVVSNAIASKSNVFVFVLFAFHLRHRISCCLSVSVSVSVRS